MARIPRLVPLLVAAALCAVTAFPAPGRATGDAATAALMAALPLFEGVPVEVCEAGQNLQQRQCVRGFSTPAEAERGIARFNVAAPDLFGGAAGVLGRMPSGEWGIWFVSQQQIYPLLQLPGEMVVCADGGDLAVRAMPVAVAAVVGQVPDRSMVTAEEFTLTEPGARGGPRGSGWYRLSAPVAGWSPSRSLSNTEVDARINRPPCFLRDAQETMTP